MRRPLIAGNWKLHLTLPEALDLARRLRDAVGALDDRDVAVAPVFTVIAGVAAALEGSRIAVAAQDLYWEERGAFTGEVSPPFLAEAGCTYAICGHSERRQFFGESDEDVNRKAAAALAGGLTPIACVGERLEEREAGKTLDVVRRQVTGALRGFSPDEAGSSVLAYEPIWAIGTGRTASPEQADEVHGSIRGLLSESFGAIVADRVRILYGGSVKPENVDELMARPHIDGALVGGASLKAESFARIVRFR